MNETGCGKNSENGAYAPIFWMPVLLNDQVCLLVMGNLGMQLQAAALDGRPRACRGVPGLFRRLGACVVALGLLCSASAAGDAEQVRRLLETSFGSRSGDHEPIVVRLTLSTEPALSENEVRERLDAISDRADHPDRERLEYYLKLLENPSLESVVLGLGENGTWFYERSSGGGGVRSGGLNGTRWLLGGPAESRQLTLTASGVPFPAGYNFGLLLDQAKQLQEWVLDYAGPSGPIEVESVEADADGWTARVRAESEGVFFRVKGEWRAGEPLVGTVHVFDDPEGPAREWYEYSDYENFAGDGGPLRARRVTRTRSGDVRQVAEVGSVEHPGREGMVELASVPPAPEGVKVLDFRTPNSPDHARYASTPRLTWTVNDGKDFYDTSEIRGGLSAPPAAADPDGDGSSLVLKSVSVGLACVVLGYGFLRLTRKNTV